MSFTLDQSQIEAVERAVERPFSIINGGAGCGKTTIIREIVNRLEQEGEIVKLCSPTGKAAARLRQASGCPACTVHSLLRFDGERFAAGPFAGSSVIIDESSMMDSALLAEIAKRHPDRLVLVGDQAQLPPVGAGQPFHDVIRFYPETVRTLTTCYRNAEAVFRAASAIRAGRMPELHAESAHEKWDVHATGEPEETQRVILEWVRQGVFDFKQDIILAPKNGERNAETGEFPPCTVNRLNLEIVKLLNPRNPAERRRFLPGDRVIVTKNNAEKDIWNGTTGTVARTDMDGGLFMALDPLGDEEPPEVRLSREETADLQHAYALTVHKSQGSQYRKVLFVCLMRDRFILDRSLVYTAVTRTRCECLVAGQLPALAQALGSSKGKETVIQLVARRKTCGNAK